MVCLFIPRGMGKNKAQAHFGWTTPSPRRVKRSTKTLSKRALAHQPVRPPARPPARRWRLLQVRGFAEGELGRAKEYVLTTAEVRVPLRNLLGKLSAQVNRVECFDFFLPNCGLRFFCPNQQCTRELNFSLKQIRFFPEIYILRSKLSRYIISRCKG